MKFKAAAQSPIRPGIQTRDNVTLSPSVLNAMTLTSQAAFLTTPFASKSTTLPTISAVSSQTVVTARNDILSAATATSAGGGLALLTYTSSQPHGLVTGESIEVAGFIDSGMSPLPNRTGVITVVDDTTFTMTTGSLTPGGSAGGTGRIVDRVYYTTTVPHGVSPGNSISITDLPALTASDATVALVPSPTSFMIVSTEVATAQTGQTGTIVGRVYYTTSAAHTLSPSRQNEFVTVAGITGVTAFNVARGTVIATPSGTVFVLAGTTVGTVTSQTGTLVFTVFANPNVSLTGLSSVRPMPPNNVNNPNALSTLSWTSGTSGSVGSTTSSKFAQIGGLPAKNVVGTYTRLPQNAGWIQGNMISSGPKRF